MSDWLSQFNAGQMIGLCAVAGGVLIAVISVLSGAWVRVRRAEYQGQLAEAEAVLKQQMIEKGMSPEDIERVLAAGVAKSGKKRAESEERVA